MMTPQLIPNVFWVACGERLPDEGKFVWIIVGREIVSGEAHRYQREVHMGVYRGNLGFQIHPYRLPLISNAVWAWAEMIPPNPPICKHNAPGYKQDFEDGEDGEDGQ